MVTQSGLNNILLVLFRSCFNSQHFLVHGTDDHGFRYGYFCECSGEQSFVSPNKEVLVCSCFGFSPCFMFDTPIRA